MSGFDIIQHKDNLDIIDKQQDLIDQQTSIISKLQDILNQTTSGNAQAYNSYCDSYTIDSMQKKKKYRFYGSTLNTTDWEVVSIGAGQTSVVGSSYLTLTSGTTSGETLLIRSKDTYTIPMRLSFRLSSSQKIANTEFSVGIISEDGLDSAELLYSYAKNTTVANITGVVKENGAETYSASAGGGYTTTFANIYDLDVFDDEVTVGYRTASVSSAKQLSMYSNISTPDLTKKYKIYIKVYNSGIPASNTTHRVDYIQVSDFTELTTEITGGRGQNISVQGMPVNVVTMPTTTVTVSGTPNVSAVLSPSSTVGYSTFHKNVAVTASTNATLIKSSAGSIGGGFIDNRGASTIYFKLYNMTTAPTVGTSTPIFTLPIPATTRVELGTILGTFSMRFTTGISYALTGGIADIDTTAIGAGNVAIFIQYA